jgi:phenylpropionate dioxygenase-like ring-hydroxylating dioxygenase large terminal subunit
MNVDQFITGSYSGYETRLSVVIDDELTRVGPETPCGEYLRRFWHPIFIADDLGELPVALKILGEELVLFRDLSGRLGLVHKHCPHRRASLEFGRCEERGIRCCYHGWHFDTDGTLLDAPGQPQDLNKRLTHRIKLGAYPAVEYKGLIFSYMGPINEIPEFPVFDSMEFKNMERVPYKVNFRCNWLQVLDAILDPLHTSFLHSNIGRVQFSDGFGEIGHIDYFERSVWLLGINTRRVGENIWLRVNELVMPNFTQAGSAFATDGTNRRLYGRSSFTRWVVPVDDENTFALAWANFGERGDPPEWNTPEGPELIEQGEAFDRNYEERQRSPGDAEATEGMGRITVHKNENLVVSDKGIALMRKRLREQIKAVRQNSAPARAQGSNSLPIPTYGGDTVLRIPQTGLQDEALTLSKLAKAFMGIQYEADPMDEEERVRFVQEKLVELETRAGD